MSAIYQEQAVFLTGTTPIPNTAGLHFTRNFANGSDAKQRNFHGQASRGSLVSGVSGSERGRAKNTTERYNLSRKCNRGFGARACSSSPGVSRVLTCHMHWQPDNSIRGQKHD